VKPTLAVTSEWRPREFRHEPMRQFYSDSKPHHADVGPSAGGATARKPPRTPADPPTTALDAANLRLLRIFFLGRTLLIPFFVGMLVALTRPDGRMMLASLGLGALVLASVRYFQIHYEAPVTGAVFALVALGLERIDAWRPRSIRVGSVLAALVIAATAISVERKAERIIDMHTAFGFDLSGPRRAEATRQLRATEGRDLVIVEYGPEHIPHHEYVYNAADIDSADIVWARDMGAEQNRALLEYFKDRRVWRYRDGFGAGVDGLWPDAETKAPVSGKSVPTPSG
jgi:hypothetical protein